jgi:hypothetical protein
VDDAAGEHPSGRPSTRAIPVLLLAGIAVPLVIALVYLLGDTSTGSADNASRSRQPSPVPRAAPPPNATEPSTTVARPKAPAQAPVRFVLTATLGASWVEAYAGSPAGPLLYRGTLGNGRLLRLTGQRLWVRLGAASNLALTLNGRRSRTKLQGTVDVLVTPQGIRSA